MSSEFRHRNLPKGVTFQLQLDSVNVVLKPIEQDALNDAAAARPAGGDRGERRGNAFPADAAARRDTGSASVDGDAFGKTTHVSSDHPPEKRS